MYHIKNDVRSQKSADMIYQSLRHILNEKKLNEITITDIHNECGISRMTFYRLFDNINDILAWKLSICVDHYKDYSLNESDKLLFFFTYWSKHIHLVSLLSNDAKFILENLFMKDIDKNNIYDFYASSTKIAMMSSILTSWALRDGKESPSEMKEISIKIFNESTSLLTNI